MQSLENRIVQSVTIKTPCSVGWENMEGDDKVRFCQQCKLNVHNLSNMTDKEAANILTANKTKRLCVFMRKRPDGSIITDNCPEKLKKIRGHIRAYAASALMVITCFWAAGASAQGLIGGPIDPRYGTTGEVGQLADYGYDTARDISRLVTAVSFLIAFFVPMDKKKAKNLKLIAIELIALALIPVLIHIAGTYLINNFGGLGGGGI